MVDRTLSDRKIVRTAPVEVSPISTLPPGLDEGNYRGVGTLGEPEAGVLVVDGDETLTPDPILPPPGEDRPVVPDDTIGVPTNIRIKEEIFHFDSGGRAWVDVIFSFDDVPGATSYQMRLIEL